MTETPYVLLIQGTLTDSPGWHRIDADHPDNFCAVLGKLLKERGLPDAIERKVADRIPTHFAWSGANSHDARIEAARNLGERIREITLADPSARIHIVAHSHGCNVTLKAIELYLEQLRNDVVGIIRLLGTVSEYPTPNDITKLGNALKDRFGQRAEVILAEQSNTFETLKSYAPLLRTLNKYHNPVGNLVDALMALPEINGLGRITFLGPPFLRKHWKDRGIISSTMIKLSIF